MDLPIHGESAGGLDGASDNFHREVTGTDWHGLFVKGNPEKEGALELLSTEAPRTGCPSKSHPASAELIRARKQTKFVLASLLAMGLLVASCGSSEQDVHGTQTDAADSPSPTLQGSTTPTDEVASSESNAKSDTNDEQTIVEARIPLEIFGMVSGEWPTEEELQSTLDDEGRDIDAVMNDDGTVTYLMPQEEFEKLKSDVKNSLDRVISELIDSEPDVFRSVTYGDDLQEFQVTVSRDPFSNSLGMLGLVPAVAATGFFFQALTGADESQFEIQVQVVDETSGDVFDTRNLDQSDVKEFFGAW